MIDSNALADTFVFLPITSILVSLPLDAMR